MLKITDLTSLEHVRIVNFEKLKKKISKGVSIDSREVKKDEIFFAIKGERTDGHKYLKQVFENKASLAVVNESWYKKNGEKFRDRIFFVVKDTTLTLGEFARKHKSNFDVKVLLIGGSNGKTTTKDLTAAVLSQKFKILKTEGNFNNHIGLPLMLLKLNKSHEFCVLEAGCNHFGEIKYLCNIAEPDYGLITNIGKEHLEFFKNLNGVAKAEFELYDYLKQKKNSVIFVNYDDKFIKKYSGGISNENKFSYSYKFNADVKGRSKAYNKDFEPRIEISFKGKNFQTHVATFGKHSVYNGLAAVSAGLYFNISFKKIKFALENFKPERNKRMEILKFNGMTIINDTYNSNPESVIMGLDTMLEYQTNGDKFAVLADMLELGKSSRTEHSKIGKYARSAGIKNLYTYGRESYNIFNSAKGINNNFYFETKEELISMLRKNLKPDDIIYIKGSRGMKMEEVVKGITVN